MIKTENVSINGLSFVRYEDEIEAYFYFCEYVGGHWLDSGVFGWRWNADSYVSATSSSITIDRFVDGVQTFNYSVWG